MNARFAVLCLLVVVAVAYVDSLRIRRTRPTRPPVSSMTTRPTRPPRPPRPPLPLGCLFRYPLRKAHLNCDIGNVTEVPADDASRDCPDYKQGSCAPRKWLGIPCMPNMTELTSVKVCWGSGRWWRRPKCQCCQILCEGGVDVKYADCGDYEGNACDCQRGKRVCKVNRGRSIKIKVKCPEKEPMMYKLCLPQCYAALSSR